MDDRVRWARKEKHAEGFTLLIWWRRFSPKLTCADPWQARTVVLHTAPTKFRPGQVRWWIEEDNHQGFRCRGYSSSHENTEESES